MSSEEMLRVLEDVRLYIPNPDPIGSDDIWVKSDDWLDMVRGHIRENSGIPGELGDLGNPGDLGNKEIPGDLGIPRGLGDPEQPGDSEQPGGLYYIQNGWVGNAMLWWRPGSMGYTTDIREAGKYSYEDALYHIIRETDEAWSCDHVDNCSLGHIMTIDGGYLDVSYKLKKGVDK